MFTCNYFIEVSISEESLKSIWSYPPDAANDASAGVMRRAGMHEEGLLRAEARDHHGHVRDTRMFGLTLDDYPGWSAAHGVVDLRYLPVTE